jgi:hypothetical protein
MRLRQNTRHGNLFATEQAHPTHPTTPSAAGIYPYRWRTLFLTSSRGPSSSSHRRRRQFPRAPASLPTCDLVPHFRPRSTLRGPTNIALTIQDFFQLKRRPVLARQVVSAKQYLEILSAWFFHGSNATPDESRHLLLFLGEMYESRRYYIALECDPESLVAESPSSAHTLSPGEVSVPFEKKVQKARLSDDMIERIEQFVNSTLHGKIARKTRNTSPKERVVETVKFWIDQIDALSHYSFPRLTFEKLM